MGPRSSELTAHYIYGLVTGLPLCHICMAGCALVHMAGCALVHMAGCALVHMAGCALVHMAGCEGVWTQLHVLPSHPRPCQPQGFLLMNANNHNILYWGYTGYCKQPIM